MGAQAKTHGASDQAPQRIAKGEKTGDLTKSCGVSRSTISRMAL
jgi:DNA-binding MurR/RpiR family transcriptional regulator